MKRYLLIKPIVLFAAILLVFVGVRITQAAPPHHPVTYYVNVNATGTDDGTSWQNAFTDLQSALDAAVSGDEIWVAVGTYKPSKSFDNSNDPRTATFILKTGVEIYGSFAGDENQLNKRQVDPRLTILSGDIGTLGDDTDNSYHVVYADGVTDAVLDGFTVTGGRGSGYTILNSGEFAGAGMYNENSSLTVANCTFSDNQVAVVANGYGCMGLGAGMYNHNSAPIVSNCTFIANQAGNVTIYATGRGGGMYNEGYFDSEIGRQWPLVTGCTFSDNVASSMWAPNDQRFGGGGGMYNKGCFLTVDSCIFERNLGGSGGGMLNFEGCPTITNCIFNTNSTTYYDGSGGAIFNLTNAIIVNCTFYQNGWRLMPEGFPAPLFRPYTFNGGAIMDYNSRGGSEITNCIFSENAALEIGGAIFAAATTSTVGTTFNNCLFYKNIRWWPCRSCDPPVINHVDGNPNPNSANNLYDIDPVLVDPAGGDFHLRYDSPCIDAGYSLKRGYLPCLLPQGLQATDFEGDKRIVEGDGDDVPTVDIGVDEFVPNLSGLGAFLEDLADSGKLDEATLAYLLDYLDDAQTALDQDEEETAISILNELIAEVGALISDTETAQLIEMKTQAVIEAI